MYVVYKLGTCLMYVPCFVYIVAYIFFYVEKIMVLSSNIGLGKWFKTQVAVNNIVVTRVSVHHYQSKVLPHGISLIPILLLMYYP